MTGFPLKSSEDASADAVSVRLDFYTDRSAKNPQMSFVSRGLPSVRIPAMMNCHSRL